MAPARIPLEVRLVARIRWEPNGCWRWLGSLTDQGYGQAKEGGRNGRNLKAHRAVCEVMVGPVPDGLDLDHLCRHRWCVNPAHLEPVTRSVNLRRGVNVGLAGRLALQRRRQAA